MILGGETFDSAVQKLKGSYILQLSAWMICPSLPFALVAGLIIFALLTGRLRRLAHGMDAFRRGETAQQIDLPAKSIERSSDEIDRLGATFRQMAERIEEQMDQLRKSDAMRRKLVANVSHDLRTPLATLQGYIETMLSKEELLPKEERRHYLRVALRHCEHLSKLVGELLGLAKLDAYEISVHREPFNLSDLVQDVVQKFDLQAKEKRIEIVTNIEEPLPFAKADIGLIERVFENLLQNAIHFTPPGGAIRLVLRPEREDISVQVRDTGRGIPKEAIPDIFNRFYQLDKSRRGEEGHSGLGLAIAKRILELHDRSIEFSSLPGAGTTFTFHLPVGTRA